MKKRVSVASVAFLITMSLLAEACNVSSGDRSQSSAPARKDVGRGDHSTIDTKSGSGAAVAGASSGESRCRDTKSIDVTCAPFGAVANDDRDDSKAFRAALDALPPGGTLAVPHGTFLFASALVIHKPVHIKGAGPASVLTHNRDLSTSGQANFIRIGGAPGLTAGVTVSDLTLQGPGGKDARTQLIRITSNVRDVTVRNVFFRNATSSCVLLIGRNMENIEISDNRADEFYEQFVEFGSGGVREVRIERNVVKSTRGHPKLGSTEPFGIAFEPALGGDITDVSIADNQMSFEGMSKAELINTGGVSLSTGPAASFLYRGISVRGNTIRKVGVGIRVQTLRRGSVSGPGSVVISKNRIEDAANWGIQVRPAGDDLHRDTVAITENIIRGYSAQAHNRYDGIRVAGNGVGLEIRGNQILEVADGKTGYGRYGISIEPGIKNTVLGDNKIRGYKSGAILNTAESGGPAGQ